MGSIVLPTVKSVINFIMNSESYFKALFLVSGLVFIAGVLSICAGTWIVKDDQLLMEKVDALKDELKSNSNIEISNSSDGYYSIFNKKGGWLNLIHVMIGVGAVICGISLLGFIGVHKKTIFLSLTFIVLLLISILLQIASLLIMVQRQKELLEASSLQNMEHLNEDVLKIQVKLLLLEASSVISVSALVLSLVAAVMRSKLSKKEMLVEPV